MHVPRRSGVCAIGGRGLGSVGTRTRRATTGIRVMISSSFLHGHSSIAMANAAAADLFAVHGTHCTKVPRAHSMLSSSHLALTHRDYKTASRPRHRDEVFSVKLKFTSTGSTRAVTLELKPEVDKPCRTTPAATPSSWLLKSLTSGTSCSAGRSST